MSPTALADSRPLALADAEATAALGARLGAALRVGDIVCLYGPLGAGKTTLARGVVGAWTGVSEEVPSPTYTLAQIYEGPRGALWHVDLYRLKSPQDCLELGLEEAFASAAVIIEWPERLGSALPRERLEVRLEHAGAGRRARIEGLGSWEGRVDAI